MKNRIVLDFGVFNSILRELKAVRKELRVIKGEPEKKPLPRRNLRDAIGTQDVLRILKVSPATLNNYERKGLLKYHKEGQSKVFSESEVRSFKKNKGRRKRLTKNLIQKRFGND
jgi:hypothetical protein